MFTWAIIDDARDRHTTPGIARRSRLASGNCAPQPWGPAAKCPYYFFTDPKHARNGTDAQRTYQEERPGLCPVRQGQGKDGEGAPDLPREESGGDRGPELHSKAYPG